MLPIVAEEVGGEAVGLYNERVRAKNPLAALRLKNSSGLTLEGGPMTVFMGDSYVGEALVKTVKPDEQRYITYAVDLGLHVNTKAGSKTERVNRVVINRGTMRTRRSVIETKTYNLDNKDDREKVVVIEHPFHRDWKLLNKEKPIEVTDNYKRFEVKTAGKKLTAFSVREERDSWESVAVTNITPDDLLVYVQQKYLTERTKKQLEANRERERIYQDQKRLRDNLRSLGGSTEERELRSRYISQLSVQENRLDEIGKELTQLQEQRQTKQKHLDELIETLSQDVAV